MMSSYIPAPNPSTSFSSVPKPQFLTIPLPQVPQMMVLVRSHLSYPPLPWEHGEA